MNSAPPVLRMGHLLEFTRTLGKTGVPTDRYLRSSGLPVMCNDPDCFVPLLRIWSFFDAVSRHEDSTLGWRVGALVGDHGLNSGFLQKLETAPTLFQALQRFTQMANAEASHLRIGIQGRQNDVLLYTCYPGLAEHPGYRVSQAYQLEIFLDLCRHFLGRGWVPYEIGIEDTGAPPFAEEQFPGSRIRVQQPMGYIAVPRACLHKKVRGSDLKKGLADDLDLTTKLDYVDTLRALLKSYLPDGYPSARLAAALMGISERTLARRLSVHGLTYGALVDEVRFTVAMGLLQNPDPKIEDIAKTVGFDDQSNFTRMFQRVGGLSPGEFRKLTQH